ncbi:signal peptidase I [Oscillatoria acuminata]|uniref:Signal peptidase I n=1 Tax=Oscillatoria acuminata PCC 6304 TaxID=56110 RepID=K9TTF6_9CYAN|nr:signal peptidase I [Oscillatoria acuminata]AFY85264.1 signal peptidase I [Oscillatoria acuminata PCC 6304]
MTPELFNLLKLIPYAILLVVGGLSINAYGQRVTHRGQKQIVLGIALLASFLGVWLNAVEVSQLEQQPNSVYVSFGLSTGFGLSALAYLRWLYGQSKQREAESQLRQGLLERISKDVEGRRQDSLDNFYHIPVYGVQQSPGSHGLFRPIQVVVGQKTRLLDVSISKLFFQEDVGGQLLILGERGSGKTTELLGLAQTLCKRAQEDPQAPIPIIFELSNWRPSRQPIEAATLNHWMVEQLQLKYGLDPQLSQDWLHRKRLIPLLDGLDELKNFMTEAIGAINSMQEDEKERHLKLIVCSRFQDYQDCQERLSLKTAVYLKPLENEAIQAYLKHRNASHLWKVLKASPQGWLKLAKTPLLLDLMPRAYPAPIVPDCPDQAGEAACRHRLFEDYSHRQLTLKHNSEYSEEDSRRYLQQLAQILRRQGQTEFLIEEMQPDWLETPRQTRWFNSGGSLIGGLIVGLIGGLMFGLIVGLIFGLMFGLIFGLIVYPKKQIELTESFDLSGSNIKGAVLDSWIFGLIAGLIVGLICGLIGWLIGDLIRGLIVGLMCGLIVGLKGGLFVGLKAKLKVKSYPNQGIWESLKKSAIVSVLTTPIWMMEFLLIDDLLLRAGQEPIFGNPAAVVILGIGMGLLTGAFLGGLNSVLRHVLLRWILFQNQVIPWNYARFLTYASEQGLLKQSGGRFRFYHDLLREHFAGEDTARPQLTLAPPSRLWLNWTLTVMLFLGGLLLIRNVQTVGINTAVMMSPTLEAQEQVLTDELTYGYRTPQRGDIIIIKSADTLANREGRFYIRRILALPHETLEIRQGQALINDRPLKTITLSPRYELHSLTLAADEYFVVGDNDAVEELEEFAEIVPRHRIHAQVLLRLSPLSRWGRLD